MTSELRRTAGYRCKKPQSILNRVRAMGHLYQADPKHNTETSMKRSIEKHAATAALVMFFCGAVCLAKLPEAETKSRPNKTKTSDSKSGNTNSKSTEKSKPASEAEDNSSISEFAAEYARHMKKAAAAIGINRPLKPGEEKLFWTDYKSGKHSKNKEFVLNMQKAEPYHDKIRSILHVFESQNFKKLDFSNAKSSQPNQLPKK